MIEVSVLNVDDEGFFLLDEYFKDCCGMYIDENILFVEEKLSFGVLKEC